MRETRTAGGSVADVAKAIVAQDPLGAAIIGLASAKDAGAVGSNVLRIGLATVDLLGGVGGVSRALEPTGGGLSQLTTNLTNNLAERLNPIAGVKLGEDGMPSLTGAATFGVSVSFTKTKSFWSESQVSDLSAGGDITLSAGTGELALIGGTKVKAGDDITLAGPEIRIEALKDWNWSSSTTRGGSVTVSGSGVTITGNYSHSR